VTIQGPAAHGSVAGAPRDRDRLIAAVALGCTVISSGLLVWDPRTSELGPTEAATVVGRISFSSADLRRRPADRLGWSDLPAGGEVRELDALFVPPGAEAKVTFLDGTVLELDERSLVVLDAPHLGHRNVSIRQGSVEGTAGAAGLLLNTPQGTAQLSPESGAVLEVQEDLVAMAVTKGEARVGETRFGTGQRGGLSPKGVAAMPKWTVELLEPSRNHRRLFHGEPPRVTLGWAGGAAGRVQLARDRGFAFVLEEHDAAQLTFTARAAEAGVFWWRVVDEAGRPLSESRRFTVLEDVPPSLLSPTEGEVVLTDDKHLGVFSWSQVRGGSHYRFEVSASTHFATVAFSAAVEGLQLRTPLGLDEGRWYWRVRTQDPASSGVEARASPARGFRLIHKPLPEAPVLLNPEIEVEPAEK
jgi:hypothetical protein